MPSDITDITDITVRSELTPAQRDAVLELVSAAEAVDGASALSEQFRLALSGSTAHHQLAYAGDLLVGYAQIADPDAEDSAAELVVHPDHRRRRVGSTLLTQLPAAVRLWAHSSGSATMGFIAAAGLQVVRRLFVLRRPLDAEGAERTVGTSGTLGAVGAGHLPAPRLPSGVVARPFVVGRDEAAWLATNAAAFADHPEQGRVTLADLQARMAQDWFDPAGFFLVVPESASGPASDSSATPGTPGTPSVAAFHWTKIEPTSDPADRVGEVYVVGVHPAYQGHGLGREVTLLGLAHLVRQGCREAVLYVDGSNEAALRTYRRLGFQVARVETMVTPAKASQSETISVMTTADTRPEAEGHVALTSAGVERRTPPRGAGGRFVRSAASQADDNMPAGRYLEREISWLQFNERVLQLAMDESIPLLERAKFLAIFSNNLDEFFMVRVAGLKRRIATGLAVRSAAGLEPRELLDRISHAAQDLMRMHSWVFWDQVRPALSDAGITIVPWAELSEVERMPLHGLFREKVFPVLTPLAVDPAHPFPYISGLSLNLAVVLVNPKTGTEHFARVKVPPSLPRLLRVMDEGAEHHDDHNARFVPVEDVIAAHLDQLFTGMEVREHYTFRVTRNEDLEVEEDDAENLLTALEKELTRRRFGPPVRLEVDELIDDRVLDLLTRELQVTADEIYKLPTPLDLRGLFVLGDLDRSDLKDEPWMAMTHPDLAPTERSQQGDIFAAVRAKDILLHHPYDSFSTSVQAFIEQAASDPRVLAIKQTLYRTSGDSPIITTLTNRLRRWLTCWRRRRAIRTCWPSSRRSTAPPVTPRSSMPSSTRRRPASRCSRSSRSRPGSTRSTTSRGLASSSTRASTSSTASSASRPTPSYAWSSVRRPRGWCATATSARATTTPRPPGSTKTSACSPVTRRSARTYPGCSTNSPVSRRGRASGACLWRPARCAPASSR